MSVKEDIILTILFISLVIVFVILAGFIVGWDKVFQFNLLDFLDI
ncbi:hypothetical protein GCM10008931_31290 [Oceanobacillus oncorhynchi subsp. oncorhynchi]